MLWRSLIYLQSHLNDYKTNLKLVHTDSAYYYKHAEFHVFRYKKTTYYSITCAADIKKFSETSYYLET